MNGSTATAGPPPRQHHPARATQYFCIIGEWDDMNSACRRPHDMIATLDSFRDTCLEGDTDPVRGRW